MHPLLKKNPGSASARHGRFLQIHGTSKFTSPYCSTGYEIYARNIWHWDNLFRPRCIPRHNIQRKMRKSYHWRKDVYTFSPLTTHRMLKWIWPTRSLEYPTNKLLWGSISDFKKRLMDRGWPHNFEIKIAIRSKSNAPETKQQGRKRNIAFRVYCLLFCLPKIVQIKSNLIT